MKLSFFWGSERLDELHVESFSARALFVSIHAPVQLAREDKGVIEGKLRIVDDTGASYGIDVEPPAFGVAGRYGMINGYVWPRTP